MGSNWNNKPHIASSHTSIHSVMNKHFNTQRVELTRKNPASVILTLHLTARSFPHPLKLDNRYRISEKKLVILIIGKLDLCKDFEGGAEVCKCKTESENGTCKPGDG